MDKVEPKYTSSENRTEENFKEKEKEYQNVNKPPPEKISYNDSRIILFFSKHKKLIIISSGVICGIIIIFTLIFFSLDLLVSSEMGLNYSSFTAKIDESTLYFTGRYFIGTGNHFIKFPRGVRTFSFGANNTIPTRTKVISFI